MSCFGWCGSEDFRNATDTGPRPAHNPAGSSVSISTVLLVSVSVSFLPLASKLMRFLIVIKVIMEATIKELIHP